MTASPLAQRLSERELAFHHLMHLLQFTAGLLLSAVWSRPLRGRPALAAAAVSAGFGYVLVVHLPWPLDQAAAVPALHAALHAGFVVAGAVVGVAWREVRELARVLIVAGTMSAMTILSLAEISGAFYYSAYARDQEAASGIVMLAGMGLLWVVVAFADLPVRLKARPRPLAAGICSVLVAAALAVSYIAG